MAGYRCPVCDYVYDESHRGASRGLPGRDAWAQVPEDWCCPDCGVREKPDFVAV